MSARQRRRRTSHQELSSKPARRRRSSALSVLSNLGVDGEGTPVLRREEFICSTSHNAHLQEDFLEDKSRLFGRPLPLAGHGRARSGSAPGTLKKVSSESLLHKYFNRSDTRSLRSVPGEAVPVTFLETVREECKSPSRVDGGSSTAAEVSETAETSDISQPRRPPRKLWRRSKRSHSSNAAEVRTESDGAARGPLCTPTHNGDCQRAIQNDLNTLKQKVDAKADEEDAVPRANNPNPSANERLVDEPASEKVAREESEVPIRCSRSNRLIRRNSSRRPLSYNNAAEDTSTKLYKRASLTHSAVPGPDTGEVADCNPTTANCFAPSRPCRIKRESIIHPVQLLPSPEMSLGTRSLAQPRYHNGRFENPWSSWKKPSLWAIAKWKLTTKNNTALPLTEKDLDKALPIMALSQDIQTPPLDGIRITWMGHSTTLVQFDDISVMTDPMMSERASPSSIVGPKRFRRFPGSVHDLPKLDAVVISHNHYDHLDHNSVVLLNARFGADLHWFVPHGLASWLRDSGCQSVTELSWWGEGSLQKSNSPAFVFTPAQHWSKRTLTDDNKSLWGSWCILGPRHRFFFAGDTGYCTGFKEIGEQYGPFDLAAIPVGAYEPRSVMRAQHVDPEEAVKIHQDIRAKRSIGVHWGTFALANEYYLEPPQKLAEEVAKAGLAKEEFFVLKHGESLLVHRL